MNFPLAQGRYEYRPLKQGAKGWDGYAIQTCLIGAGYPLPTFGADGWIGSETHSAIARFQQANGLVKDGIAGIVTQRALVLALIKITATVHRLPVMLEESQVEAESSYWVGNYTAPYSKPGNPDDESRDLGLTMKHKRASEIAQEAVLRAVFDGPACLEFLAGDPERGLRPRHDRYWKDGKNPYVKTQQRAWELAVGSWNAPAWTDTLARGGKLTDAQREHIEGYIKRATAYVLDWTP